jgi:Icc-related predicted phosphoesterase
MRFVAVADIHGSSLALTQASALVREHGIDALLIAGDLCLGQMTRHFVQLLPEIARYMNKPIILTPGNHDFWKPEKVFSIADSNFPGTCLMDGVKSHYPVVCLMESAWEWKGVKFWGSPFVSYIDGRWNYERKRTEERFGIPDDADVVLTHSPPYGYGDMVPGGERIGSEVLMLAIQKNPNIKLYVFGHCHMDGGWEGRINNTALYNVACHDDDLNYQPRGIKIIEI